MSEGRSVNCLQNTKTKKTTSFVNYFNVFKKLTHYLKNYRYLKIALRAHFGTHAVGCTGLQCITDHRLNTQFI